MDQLKHLIEVWTGYAQGLTGSIGALAFVCAFIWMIARLDEFFISVNGQSLRIPSVAASGSLYFRSEAQAAARLGAADPNRTSFELQLKQLP